MNVQNAEFIAISEVARFTPSARIERVLGSLDVELPAEAAFEAEIGGEVRRFGTGPMTAFYLAEKDLDALLGDSDDVNGGTIWSAIKPVVEGKGPIKEIEVSNRIARLLLCAGDVLLADYEEELPAAQGQRL